MVLLEATTATGAATTQKGCVIKQKVLHSLCFSSGSMTSHSAEFSSLHINSLIFECGILILRGVEAQTHNTICEDTKADILGVSFFCLREITVEEIHFVIDTA